jgi:D-sedoheptulose 7-phosphate isomerase
MIDTNEIKARLIKSGDVFKKFAEEKSNDLEEAVNLILNVYKAGGKVLIFGNGGSAAEAQHISAELVNRMVLDREPLNAVALTTDTSILTSIANDYSYEEIFSKQVKGLGVAGDLAWGMSTSGASKNVLSALEVAREKGMKTLGMAGAPGKPIGELCDVCLYVDTELTAIIQEVHLAASHIICDLVERELFGG